jgi:hypothetical protein
VGTLVRKIDNLGRNSKHCDHSGILRGFKEFNFSKSSPQAFVLVRLFYRTRTNRVHAYVCERETESNPEWRICKELVHAVVRNSSSSLKRVDVLVLNSKPI